MHLKRDLPARRKPFAMLRFECQKLSNRARERAAYRGRIRAIRVIRGSTPSIARAYVHTL